MSASRNVRAPMSSAARIVGSSSEYRGGLARRHPGVIPRVCPLPQESAQLLILIACDVVDAGLLCGAPSLLSRSEGAEVVAAEPAVAAFFFIGCSVEGIEADPKAV